MLKRIRKRLHISFLKISLYLHKRKLLCGIQRPSAKSCVGQTVQFSPFGEAAAMWGRGFGHLAVAISLVISSLCCSEVEVGRQQTGDGGQVRGHNWALLIARVEQRSKEERKATGRLFVLFAPISGTAFLRSYLSSQPCAGHKISAATHFPTNRSMNR